ncbi:MAG: DUF3795 domain-containing protein [candidate division WOR-3 bacterium]|jgi:predicted amidophosphoribosyltransferase
MKSGKSRRWFLTPCGLDCYGCPIRLRTKEELSYWAERKVDPEKIRCAGCRSPRDEHHWSPECNILECCVYERKHEFCAQCRDFPCQILEVWASEYEHHSQAISRLKEMKKTGVEAWLQERLRDV